MSGSGELLRHRIASATDLQSVVRTMRAIAASGLGQYRQSVLALADYHRAVELGLVVCLRGTPPSAPPARHRESAPAGAIGAIVFGSDQGLVGPFNDLIVDHAIGSLATLPGRPSFWAVGERVHARLVNAGATVIGTYPVPVSVEAIAALVSRIQLDTETHPTQIASPCVHLFHHRPKAGSLYEPVGQRLLPLDAQWQARYSAQRWPTANLPEVVGSGASTLRALVREYLYISIFRACAESLASENASRLAAMERADKNIDELLASQRGALHRMRQNAIDAELFDLSAAYESMSDG